MIPNPEEYPLWRPFRGFNPKSQSVIGLHFVGACIPGISNGDYGIYDKDVEIVSGDFVLVRALTRTSKIAEKIEFATKCLMRCGSTIPWGGGESVPSWYLGSNDGIFPFEPKHHEIVARLVCMGTRKREAPPINPELNDELIAGSTPEYRARLHEIASTALHAINRDGLDHTTMFRAAAASRA